jgi:hypothetical protein
MCGMFFTFDKLFNVFGSISISKTSISANILNNKLFPPLLVLKPQAHISNPKTAVPLVITATKFPLVYCKHY